MIFLIGLVLLMNAVTQIVTNKLSEQKLKSFFEEEQDFDVLYMGISHMMRGLSPLDAYNDYGIASFNFGEAGNRLPQSYWVLQNALKYTTPKLVIIDVRRLELKNKKTTARYAVNFDMFPLDRTKIDAAMDLLPTWEKRIELLFPLIKYHQRWGELTKEDFHVTKYDINKGTQYYRDDLVKVARPARELPYDTDKKRAGSELMQSYLRKMIEYCRDRGIEVMLLEMPYPADKKSRMLANGAQDIADEYGILYLNCLETERQGVINYNTDMNDTKSHLNDSGAKKFTDYLCSFIKENYDIPDRREDPAYASWNDDYAEFAKQKCSRILAQTQLDRVLMLLADKHMNCRIFINGSPKLFNDERMRMLLENIPRGEETLHLPAIGAMTYPAYYADIRNEEGTVREQEEIPEDGDWVSPDHDVSILVTEAETGEVLEPLYFDMDKVSATRAKE
ncbi:MAG: hypothetical protein IJJ52_01215 [Lachnospiraceae bacterium]|nr:hypothetical protein [Lachnospiraceae bacterium]